MRKMTGVLLAAGAPVVGFVTLVYLAFLRKPYNHPKAFLESGRRPTTQTLVVCAGASLTHASLSGDYVAMLRSKLGRRGWEFVNAGINGDTTLGLLRRLGDDVVACRPDAVTILIGTNDARDGSPGRVAPGAFGERLGAMLARLRAETGARVAVLSLPPLGEDLTGEANRRVGRFNAVMEEVAAAHGAAYLPLNEELRLMVEREVGGPPYDGPRPALMLANALRRYALRQGWDEAAERNGFVVLTDGIHLNDRGAAVAADLIARWLSRPAAGTSGAAVDRRNEAEGGHPGTAKR